MKAHLNRSCLFCKILPVVCVFFLSWILLYPHKLYSDTVILKNGTLLVGKVKSESAGHIVFKNSYGAFTVIRKDITKLYITGSYKEDIAIRKKLGMDFSEEDIKNNYTAGQAGLTEKERTLVEPDSAAGPDLEADLKFFAEGGGLASAGELRRAIPYGFSFFAGLEVNAFNTESAERNYYIPWLRAGAGYIAFSRDDSSLEGFTSGAGPLWIFPLPGKRQHNIRFSAEPGISGFRIRDGGESATTFTFTFHSVLGYEYSFSSVSVFINFRYMYVYDRDVVFNSAGLSAGVSRSLFL